MQRRPLLAGLGLASVVPAAPALAYETYKDSKLGFTFTYPTGLQKSENKAYTFLVRDLIEPLESVGIQVTDTTRKSLDEVGTPMEVATKLLADVVPQGAPKEIIKAEEKRDKATGRRYDLIEYAYQWKFSPEQAAKVGGRLRYQLHSKALVTIDRKRQYLVLASAEEKRWPVQGDQLTIGLDTFKLIFE